MSEHGEDKVESRKGEALGSQNQMLQVTPGHAQETEEVGSLFPWENSGNRTEPDLRSPRAHVQCPYPL